MAPQVKTSKRSVAGCLPAAFSAEVMAHQGWDSLTIDLSMV
jgi:2-keto-3-deoxy-L-rhamnonate aldolase RhmA